MGPQPCLCVYVLLVAAFTLQWQSWLVAPDTDYYLALYRKVCRLFSNKSISLYDYVQWWNLGNHCWYNTLSNT